MLASAGDIISIRGTVPLINITKNGLTVDGNYGTPNAGRIDGAVHARNARCIQVNADNVTVRGMTVERCGSHNIITYRANTIIEGNYVYRGVTEAINSGGGSCIKGERGASNVTVRNNIVVECYNEGIALTMTLGGEVYGNYVENATSVSIYIDNSKDVIVRDNHAVCTGLQAHLINGRRAAGIALGEESYSGWGAHLDNVFITRNVIEGCSTGIIAFASYVGGTTSNVTIHDNWIPSGQDFAISIDNARCENVFITNNKIWRTQIWTRCNSGRTLSGNVLSTITPTPGTSLPSPSTNTPAPNTFTATPTRTPTATHSQTATNTPITTAPNRPPDGCMTNGDLYICYWFLP
ncbi:MAG: right-handed parallel beta-helix repeat-containing protein [candidate division KSB1 bacterium]|nr:right-handed parallel beta-helix repeat-containing protein [candidate division KSB1 bacterium]